MSVSRNKKYIYFVVCGFLFLLTITRLYIPFTGMTTSEREVSNHCKCAYVQFRSLNLKLKLEDHLIFGPSKEKDKPAPAILASCLQLIQSPCQY